MVGRPCAKYTTTGSRNTPGFAGQACRPMRPPNQSGSENAAKSGKSRSRLNYPATGPAETIDATGTNPTLSPEIFPTYISVRRVLASLPTGQAMNMSSIRSVSSPSLDSRWKCGRCGKIVFMNLAIRLVELRRFRIARFLLAVTYNVDIPKTVRIGVEFQLPHSGMGTVIFGGTVIADRVQIFQQVTIGRSDAHIPRSARKRDPIILIGDDAILCPGAKIIASGDLTVAPGTIVTPNSVLTESTEPWQVWSGNPAKPLLRKRST